MIAGDSDTAQQDSGQRNHNISTSVYRLLYMSIYHVSLIDIHKHTTREPINLKECRSQFCARHCPTITVI